MKLKEIEKKIGTLSNPSKMPSYAWGIPIQYIEQQVENAWEDYKYITQILRDYFTDEVKDMSDKEFKDHLIGLNWEIDE